MPAPPLIRLGSSCCNHLVKRCSFNNNLLLRCKSSVIRSVAYTTTTTTTTTTTCSDQQLSSDSSSSDTNVLIEKQKLGGKFNYYVINEALEEQLKRERTSTLLFMRQLKESGFKHDLETYMSVVRLLSYWDWGMDARSDNLLDDVIDNTNWEVSSFEISDQLFDALMEENLTEAVKGLVEVYASAGRFDEAIHTLSEMKNRIGLMPSNIFLNHVLDQLIEWDKEDIMIIESVYRDLKRLGLIPDVHTYSNLMTGICKKGCEKLARNVIDEMEEAGVEPSAVIRRWHINRLCRKGKPELAFQLVKFMSDSNKQLVAAYGRVIHGFVQESKLQDAEDAFLDMKLRQVVPDEHCYEPLITGYCKKGAIEKALDLFKEMESNGIETFHLLARQMMGYLRSLGMLDEALCLFKHFTQQQQSREVFLDEDWYNTAIDCAYKLGKMDDAMGLVEEMKARQIKAQGLNPTGLQGQWVQPNVGQDEGVEGVPDAGVECGHDGVVQDARDEAAVGQLHTTQQIPALQLTSVKGFLHYVILKTLRKTERQVKMKIRKAVYDKDGGGISLDKSAQLDEA